MAVWAATASSFSVSNSANAALVQVPVHGRWPAAGLGLLAPRRSQIHTKKVLGHGMTQGWRGHPLDMQPSCPVHPQGTSNQKNFFHPGPPPAPPTHTDSTKSRHAAQCNKNCTVSAQLQGGLESGHKPGPDRFWGPAHTQCEAAHDGVCVPQAGLYGGLVLSEQGATQQIKQSKNS